MACADKGITDLKSTNDGVRQDDPFVPYDPSHQGPQRTIILRVVRDEGVEEPFLKDGLSAFCPAVILQANQSSDWPFGHLTELLSALGYGVDEVTHPRPKHLELVVAAGLEVMKSSFTGPQQGLHLTYTTPRRNKSQYYN